MRVKRGTGGFVSSTNGTPNVQGKRRSCLPRRTPSLIPYWNLKILHTYLLFYLSLTSFNLFLPTLVLNMDLFTDPHAASASASVSPAGESNNPAVKNRSACDRCHSQKLRCVKRTGQVTCARCLKLKTICRFSPRAPRASLKLPEQATGYPQGYWHDPVSMTASIPWLWNMHASPMTADVSDIWNPPLEPEKDIAEAPGKCWHSCQKLNQFEITCFL